MAQSRAQMSMFPKGYLGGAYAALQRIKLLYQDVMRQDEYEIRGITQPSYHELNGRRCIEYKDAVVRFKRYKNGSLVLNGAEKVKERIPVPVGAAAIITDVLVSKAKELYTASADKGCRFVDVVTSGNGNYSRYIIPLANLHKVNFVSLVISPTRLRNHLGALVVYTLDNEPIYLFIVPYKCGSSNYNIHIGESFNELNTLRQQIVYSLFINGIIMDYMLTDEVGRHIALNEITSTLPDFKCGVSVHSLANKNVSELSVLLE